MKINIRRSFALKLGLYIITCMIIVFIIGTVLYYQVSKELIIENTSESLKSLAGLTVGRVDSMLSTVKTVSKDIASFVESSNPTEEGIVSMLRAVVQNTVPLHSGTVCFEPYKFSKDKYYFGPSFYKSKTDIKYLNLGTSKYDYFNLDWYAVPKKSGSDYWSEPYSDDKTFIIAYSNPIFKNVSGKKEFCGVAACKIALDWLVDMLSEVNDYKTGFAFILSSKGNLISHPEKKYYTENMNFFDLWEKYGGDPAEKIIAENMIAGKSGFEKYFSNILNKTAYVYYQPLDEINWSLGIVIPEDKLFAKLERVTVRLLIIGTLGYILTLVMIGGVINFAISPLRILVKATLKIGEGDFGATIPVLKHQDEVGLLSMAFRNMQENLKIYVTNLQKTTADKEKIEQELSIANSIQQRLLPREIPHLKEVDLCGVLVPAREVGGDIYDFFFIDNKHLCFGIGDASGKGVGAALFMAVAKTLLKAKLSIITDPAKMFIAMNEDLCRDNESCMFVTFFLGILNIETGELKYCNAGHSPPLVHTVNKGFYYFHEEDPHPPLGIIENVNYVGNSIKLLPEDIFFLYTDGVTEAMNSNNIQFSEEKLLKKLAENKDEPVSNIISNVKVAIEQHAAGAVQSDDITMFILKYNGPVRN